MIEEKKTACAVFSNVIKEISRESSSNQASGARSEGDVEVGKCLLTNLSCSKQLVTTNDAHERPLGNASGIVVDGDHKVAISCTITIAIPDGDNTCFGGTEDGTSVGCALREAVELRKSASDVDAGNSLADVDAGEATCKNLATTSSGQIDDVTRTVCNVSKRVLGQFRGDCNSSQNRWH